MVTFTKGSVYRYFRENVQGVAPEHSIALLRKSYKAVAIDAGVAREKLAAQTACIEHIKQKMGSKYGHLQIDALRDHIITCCKNPNNHGGDWNVSNSNNHGAAKGFKDSIDAENAPDAADFYARIKEPDWGELTRKVKKRDGGRCRVCNSGRSLHAHHRTYSTMRTPLELSDLTTLCRPCHMTAHGK